MATLVVKDQSVYYFNIKEIMGNKFGIPSPIILEVMNKNLGMSRTVSVHYNVVYSIPFPPALL